MNTGQPHSNEIMPKCGRYLRKSNFGQHRHYCGRPLTHVVVIGDSIQAYGCETHAKAQLQSYRSYPNAKVRPASGQVIRQIWPGGIVTYTEQPQPSSNP